MIIGVPKEVKDHETRVGLVPAGVVALRESGHDSRTDPTPGSGRGETGGEANEAGH